MSANFIPPHGGYEKLLSFQKARIVYDGTVWFCEHFLNRRDRTIDQMVQAARSGKLNILEGSQASGTSKDETYRSYIETRPPEVVANIIICLIHQANYLLDQQIRQLEQAFLKEGGLRERMTRARLSERGKQQRRSGFRRNARNEIRNIRAFAG